MIDIDLPYAKAIKRLRVLIARAGNRRELMGRLAGIMHRAAEDNLAEQGRPKWVDLAESTKASRAKAGTWPGLIMQRSGQLAASFQPFSSDSEAGVGTNKVYAAAQHYGMKTGPRVILPRGKKALSFGGIVVSKVNHPGSTLPARPVLQLTPEDMGDMVREARDFLREADQGAT